MKHLQDKANEYGQGRKDLSIVAESGKEDLETVGAEKWSWKR